MTFFLISGAGAAAAGAGAGAAAATDPTMTFFGIVDCAVFTILHGKQFISIFYREERRKAIEVKI